MPRRRPVDPPDLPATLEIALHFLGTRPRSRWELERRLDRNNAPPDTVTAALERLTDLGYLDDRAFVRWWGEQRDRHAPRGRRLLELELRQKGVPRDVIEEMRGEPLQRAAEDADLPETEEQRATATLESHLHGGRLPDDPKALQRVGMFLMRRGFDPETVRRAIRQHQSGKPVDD